jgi:hypothetical protein
VLLDLMFEAEREAVLATAHVGTYRDGAGEFGYKRSPLVSAPRRVSVILGETIQALKRSLDYVVYELAFLDSGSEQNDTQFPIDSSPETFRRRLKRDHRGEHDHRCYLIGVSEKHAAVIERYQPYRGVDWTKRLQRLSNPDKHRRLTAVRHVSKSAAAYSRPTDPAIAKVPGGFHLVMQMDDMTYVKVTVSILVALDDGSPVVQTLEQLKTEVAGVLEEFTPCFESQCHHDPPR